jgi:photosystem II stability/assembly factor-like uncharacterized protein
LQSDQKLLVSSTLNSYKETYSPFFQEDINPEKLPLLSDLRAYQDIPEAGFYNAFLYAKRQTGYTTKAGDSDQWKSIGPFNLAGRMLGLAVDPDNPNRVWAGSATGGLWKLTITSEGAYDYHWERIETGEPVLGVRSIAIDPGNSNIIYIGTGEAHFHRNFQVRLLRTMYTYGIGILKSVDGGETWTKTLDWSYHQSRGVQCIEINPHNTSIVYAGTTEGTYRTINGGKQWVKVHPVLMAMDIVINPQHPDTLFVSCGNAGSEGTGIYRSFDGGDSWEKLTNGLPSSWSGKVLMDIYRENPAILFADVSNLTDYIGLYKSEDHGEHWALVTQEHMGNAMGMYAHYVRVNPEDSSKLFKTEIHYGYSDDGGNTWEITDYIDDEYAWLVDTTCMHVDHHVFANDPTDPNTFYTGNDGGIYRTKDGGRTFQDLNRGLVTTQFYPGFTSSQTDTALALGGVQDNGTSLFNGSPEWNNWILGGDGSETAIHPENDDVLYVSFYKLSIFRSMNRGEDLQFIGPVDFWSGWYGNQNSRAPRADEVAKMAPFILLENNIMYAATNYVYLSIDAGETWIPCNDDREVTSEPIMSISASRIDPQVVYVASRPNLLTGIPPHVMVSKNGGSTWTDITGSLPDRDIIVQVAPHSPYIVYAVVGGFGTSHLFRSYDAGLSRNDIGQGLPDVPTNAVAIDPEYPQNIYVGNDLGVWVSTDNGLTWKPLRTGMPTASIVLDFSILENTRKIRAVTHGNGIYEKTLVPPEAGYVDSLPELPSNQLIAARNYPNPFRDETTIVFELTEPSNVEIDIYDSNGRLVRSFPSTYCHTGKNQIIWDARISEGASCPPGIYFVKISAEQNSLPLIVVRL